MTFFLQSNKKQLVISRYEENIDWIENVAVNFDEIIVYNKGKSSFNKKSEKIKEQKLPNIGRESHSFLHHIIQNYDNINKYAYLVFSQSDPFDHCSRFMELVNNRDNYSSKPFYFIRESNDKFVFYYEPIEITHPNGLPLVNFYYHIFCDEQIEKLPQSRNSLMIIPVKNIKFRSVDFYKHLLNFVNKSENPLEGYILERLWIPIFDGITKDWFTHYNEYKRKFLGVWKNIPIT